MLPRVLTGVALVAILSPALAQRNLDFRAVGDAPAILFDAPTLRGKKLFVAPRGMPFEVVVSIEGWLKVRDRTGDMAWIERRAASDRRTVVSIATAQIRERADDSASVVFEVAADVVLELADTAVSGGWVRVRHRDGAVGYVRTAQVWGT